MLFAHQGGWDEMLYIGLPVLGVLWMLKVSERKARERAEIEEAEESDSEDETSHEENGAT